MKKVFSLLVAVMALSGGCMAQSAYCLTFDDYREQLWHPIDGLRLQRRSAKKSILWGGASIKPVTGNKKTDKMLKKNARLVRHCDSLFVNCRHLACEGTRLDNSYAPAFVFERDYLIFIAPNYKFRQKVSSMSIWFGIIGGAIAAATSHDVYVCYILNPATELVEPVDQRMMERLLDGHQHLMEELNLIDEEERYSPRNVLPVLRRLGLVSSLTDIQNQP